MPQAYVRGPSGRLGDLMGTFSVFDTTDNLVGKGSTIKQAGYSGVIKYAKSSSTFPNKSWTKAEVAEMHVHGIKCGVIFETFNTIDGFSTESGADAGKVIVSTMRALGFPSGHSLGTFFAADDDFAKEQILGKIKDFAVAFRGQTNPAGYLCSGYGSGLFLQLLGRSQGGLGLLHYHWLSNAPKWTGFDDCVKSGNWDILQLLTSPMKLSADGDNAKTLDWAY